MVSARLPMLTLDPAPPVSGELFEPTYQNRLRVVGRVLDEWRLDQAVIVEVADGIVLRAHDPETGRQLAELMPDEELKRAMEKAVVGRGSPEQPAPASSPLRPTGYEDFLRALGFRLDQQRARSIVVVECSSYVHVSGLELIGPVEQAAPVPFSFLYEAPMVRELVNEAASRRQSERLDGAFSGESIAATEVGRVIDRSGRRHGG